MFSNWSFVNCHRSKSPWRCSFVEYLWVTNRHVFQRLSQTHWWVHVPKTLAQQRSWEYLLSVPLTFNCLDLNCSTMHCSNLFELDLTLEKMRGFNASISPLTRTFLLGRRLIQSIWLSARKTYLNTYKTEPKTLACIDQSGQHMTVKNMAYRVSLHFWFSGSCVFKILEILLNFLRFWLAAKNSIWNYA